MSIFNPGRRRAAAAPAAPEAAAKRQLDDEIDAILALTQDSLIDRLTEKVKQLDAKCDAAAAALREDARQVANLIERLHRAEERAEAAEKRLAELSRAERAAEHAALLRSGQPVDVVRELGRQRLTNLALSNQLATAENRPQIHQGPWS